MAGRPRALSVPRSARRWAVLALLCALAVPLAAEAGLRPNPANDPRLLDKPLEGYRYDYARRCRDHPTAGIRALKRWLERNVRGESWGIMRCEKLSRRNYSLHSEGRAIDWHLDARNRRQRRAAKRLIHTLLEKDRYEREAALARRMGVQGIIFNCKSWWSGMSGLGKYSYCYRENGKRRRHLDPTAAHEDHIHIELNWPGARKRTSFWRSPLARR
jgi:hypothetical protein